MNVTIEADHATQLFDKTSNLITEAILRFKEDKLVMTTADPAMVSMIHLEIPEDSFKNYNINPGNDDYEHFTEEEEEGVLIGLNLDNLSKILKAFDEDITLSIDLDTNEMVLKEGNDRFTLPILNLDTDDIPSMGELEHDIKSEITHEQFKELRKKLEIATDSCTIRLDNEGELEVEGGGDQMSVETSAELENTTVMNEDEDEVESMFDLSYIKKAERMFNKVETCDSLDMMVGENFPLQMTHDCNRETLKFVLAPRIEEK